VDDALLDGAGAILAALADGGPAQDMADYAEAVPCLTRYADLIEDRDASLDRLNSLITLRGFLRDPDPKPDWPDGALTGLRDRFEGIMADPRWATLVLTHLADPLREDFRRGLWTAERLKLPVVPQILAHLEVAPYDDWAWSTAIRLAGSHEATQIASLAERLLPLDTLANGPGEHLGFGDDAAPDRALESVVSGLDDHPGVGLPLIRAALANRVTRVRRAAVAALAGWPADSVPATAVDWVRTAGAIEPDDATRDEMTAFITSHD
jgi:hypothetical protein